MVKVKTVNLNGPALDWAVATCKGHNIQMWHTYRYLGLPHQECVDKGISIGERDEFGQLSFSAESADVFVEILEEEKIGVVPAEEGSVFPDGWIAAKEDSPYFFGPTPQTAVMRCYVASKMGDEVEVPDELLET